MHPRRTGDAGRLPPALRDSGSGPCPQIRGPAAATARQPVTAGGTDPKADRWTTGEADGSTEPRAACSPRFMPSPMLKVGRSALLWQAATSAVARARRPRWGGCRRLNDGCSTGGRHRIKRIGGGWTDWQIVGKAIPRTAFRSAQGIATHCDRCREAFLPALALAATAMVWP